MTLRTSTFVVPSLKLSTLYDFVQAKCPAITETDKHFHHDSTYSNAGIVFTEQRDSSPGRKLEGYNPFLAL